MAGALEAEAINVGLIGRMLERGTETDDDPAGSARHGDRRPVRPRPRPLRRHRSETPAPRYHPDLSRPQAILDGGFARRPEQPDDRPTVTPELEACCAA